MNNLTTREYCDEFVTTHYNEIESAPCGCPECSRSVQPGHLACSTVSDEILLLESAGRVCRAYDDGAWRWFVKEQSRLSAAPSAELMTAELMTALGAERIEELLANPLRRYWLPGTTDGYLTPSEVRALPAGSNFAFDECWSDEAPLGQGVVSGPDEWGRYTLTRVW